LNALLVTETPVQRASEATTSSAIIFLAIGNLG